MPTKSNALTVAEIKEQLNTLDAKPSKALDKLSENFLNANFTTAQFIDCLNYRGKSDLSFILLLAKHSSEKNLYMLLKKFSEILEKEPQACNDIFGCFLLENDMSGNFGILACAKSNDCSIRFLNLLEQLTKTIPAHTILEHLMHTTIANQTLLMYVIHKEHIRSCEKYFELLHTMLETHPELSEKIYAHLMQQNTNLDAAFHFHNTAQVEGLWYQFILKLMVHIQPIQLFELLSLQGSQGVSMASKTTSHFSKLFYLLGYLIHQGIAAKDIFDILIQDNYINRRLLDKQCQAYAYTLFQQLLDHGISSNQIKFMYRKDNMNNLEDYIVANERNPEILYKLINKKFLTAYSIEVKKILMQHIFNLPLEEKINAFLNLKNINHPLSRFLIKVADKDERSKLMAQVDIELKQALEFQENQQHIASYYNASEYAAYTRGNLYPMFAPVEVHPPATPYPTLNTQVPTGDLISFEEENQQRFSPRN